MSFRNAILASVSAFAVLSAAPVAFAACEAGADAGIVCTAGTHTGTIVLTDADKVLAVGAATITGSVTGTNDAAVVVGYGAAQTFLTDHSDFDPQTDEAKRALLRTLHDGVTGAHSLTVEGGVDFSAANFGDAILFGDLTTPFFRAGNDDDTIAIARNAKLTGDLFLNRGPAHADDNDTDRVFIFGQVQGDVDLGEGADMLVGAYTDAAFFGKVADVLIDEGDDADLALYRAMHEGALTSFSKTGLVLGNVVGSGETSILNMGDIIGDITLSGVGHKSIVNFTDIGSEGSGTGNIDLSATTSGDMSVEIHNMDTIWGDVTMGGTVGAGTGGGESPQAIFNAARVPGYVDAVNGIFNRNEVTEAQKAERVFRMMNGDAALYASADAPAGYVHPEMLGYIKGGVNGGTGDFFMVNLGHVDGHVDVSHTNYAFIANAGVLRSGITAGNNTADIVNVGTIQGQVTLGGGDGDVFINGNTSAAFGAFFADLAGEVVGIDATGTISTRLATAAAQGGRAGVSSAINGGVSGDHIANLGTVNGNITTNAGNDVVYNYGTVNGDVALGDGDDRFFVGAGSSVTGVVSGGSGANTLSFVAGGTGYYSAADFVDFGTVTPGWTVFNPSNVTQSAMTTVVTSGLTLSGARDRFTLEGGSSVGGAINGAGTGELVLDGEGVATGGINNFGTVRVRAGGLEQPSWWLGGTITVDSLEVEEGGGVAFNGAVTTPGGVTVQRAGRLGGSGTINGNVTNRGILAPGNSIGTLTVNGTFTQNGEYEVEVDPAAVQKHDKIEVSNGNFVIDPAATVRILPEDNKVFTAANFEQTQNYEIVSVTNGTVNGRFGNVSSDIIFLTPTLNYTTNAVSVTLVRTSDFAASATNPSQRGVAGALDGLLANGAFNGAGLSTPAAVQTALDTTKGDVVGSTVTATGSATGVMTSGISRAMGGVRAALNGPARASGVSTGDPVARDGNVWASGLGSFGMVESKDGVAGYDSQTFGLSAGFDVPIAANLVGGVALGYTRTNVDSDRAGDQAGINSYQIAPYLTFNGPDGWYASGLAHYTRHQYDTDRQVTAGAFSAKADASYGANEFGAYAEAGRSFTAGALVIAPHASLGVSALSRDAYRETGAGAFNLDVAAQTYTTGKATGMVRVAYPYASQGGWSVEPDIGLGATHRFGDVDGTTSARFTGGATPFTVRGGDIGKTAALASAGLVTSNGATSLFGRYEGEFNADLRQHTLTAGVRFAW